MDVVAFLNGRIMTMDPSRRVVSGLVAEHGRITRLGDSRQIEPELPPGAEVIDLGGRVVLPGFIDAHCHLELSATHLAYAVQCFAPPHRTLSDICLALAERARNTPQGEWIVGRANFSLERWVEDRRSLHRTDLDRAVPEHPTVVFSGLHVCTLNTRALEITGLDRGPLPRGASVDIDSGTATELWAWLPLPRYSVEETISAIVGLGRSLFQARGVTTIAEIPFTANGLDAYRQLHRQDRLPARFGLWYHLPRFGTIEEVLRDVATLPGDEWLRLGGIKLFVDGAGQDAWGRPISDLQWDQEDLDEVVFTAHRAALQVWMHVAPTKCAAEMALTALERAIARSPRADHRHRIEHLGDMRPDRDLLVRARGLGVIPVATPQFVYSYGDTDPEGSCAPLRTLRELGFPTPGNSDCTGTQPEAANPFHGIWCAMARRTRGGSVLDPDERIDLDPALRAFTADAAFACHMVDRGTLEPGKLADLAVLGRDPADALLDELPDIPVDMTVVGGDVVWERG